MTRRTLTPLLLLVALAGPGCALDRLVAPDDANRAAAPVTPPTATGDFLSNADSVAFEVVASGCFHHEEYTLVLVPDSLGARTQLRVKVSDGGLPGIMAFPLLAPARVDIAQRRGLDLLLRKFRQAPAEQSCTSTQTLDVVTWRGDAVVSREHLFDGSCDVDDDPAGIVYLGQLVTQDRTEG